MTYPILRDTLERTKLRTLPLPEVIGFCTLTYLDLLISPSHLPSSGLGVQLETAAELGSTHSRFDLLEGQVTVVCGSENGYLILRDLVSGEVVLNERVHQGSIEGLVRHGEETTEEGLGVVTCSSDCCVQINTFSSLNLK